MTIISASQISPHIPTFKTPSTMPMYSIDADLLTTVIRNFKKAFGGNENFSTVTLSSLSLGERDATTGWFEKVYTDSSIDAFIIQREAQTTMLKLGYYVNLDALAFTATPMQPCDLITDAFDRVWEVKTCKPIIVGNIVQFFIADLQEVSLNE